MNKTVIKNKTLSSRFILCCSVFVASILLIFSSCNMFDEGKDKLNEIVDNIESLQDDANWKIDNAGRISSKIPESSTGEDETTFLFFGDIQPEYSVEEYQDFAELVQLARNTDDGTKAGFALQCGDIVNTGDSPEEWIAFFDSSEAVFEGLPLFTAPGNHEVTGFTEEAGNRPEYYLDLFDLPENGPEGYEKEYYSIDWGMIHIVSLSSNYLNPGESYSDDPEENARIIDKIDRWITDDLSSSYKPWKIILMHHPAWQVDADPTQRQMEERWRPIFENEEVDLILCGHEHIIARSLPMLGSRVEVDSGEWQGVFKGAVQMIGNASNKFYEIPEPQPIFIETAIAGIKGWHTITATKGLLSVMVYDSEGLAFDYWEKEK